MNRGSNGWRGGGGGGGASSSWELYESNGGHNGGGSGHGHRDRGGRGGSYSRSTDQLRLNDQDGMRENYDRAHGNAHPNNANVRRAGPNNDSRQRSRQQPNPHNRNDKQAANDGPSRGEGSNNDGDGNFNRGRQLKSNFANHADAGKSARGGGNASDRRNDNGENNHSSYSNGREARNGRQHSHFRNNSSNSSSSGQDDRSPRPNGNSRRSPRPPQQQQRRSYDDASPTTHGPPPRSNKVQLQVLYTHQKTKKKKSWKDGRLVLLGTSGQLFEACPNPGSSGVAIDALELSGAEARALADGQYGEDCLESEKFLVQVEGPWTTSADGRGGGGDAMWNKRPQASSSSGLKPRPSCGMKRVISTKFRVPGRIRPMHPEEKRRRAWAENGTNGRSRPLQPGELERQFYGDAGGGCAERDGGGYGNDGRGYGGRDGGGYGDGQDFGADGGWERNDHDRNTQGYQGDGRPGWENHGGDWGNDDGSRHAGNQGYHQSGDDGSENLYDGNERVENRGGRPPPPHYQGGNDDGYQNSSSGFDGNGPGPSRQQPPPGSQGRRGNYARPPLESSHGDSHRGGSGAKYGSRGGGNGPAQFQANEFDPNGFYEEEEESEEEEEPGERQHGGGHGREFRDHDGNGEVQGRMQQGPERRNDSNWNQQRAVYFRDDRQGEDGNSTWGGIQPGEGASQEAEHATGKLQQTTAQEDDYPMMPPPASQQDQHATSDELLALFGATPDPPETLPAQKTSSQGLHPSNSRSAIASDQNKKDDEACQNDDRKDSNNRSEDNSFLASILQAEEQVKNRGVTLGGGHAGDLSFCSGGLGGWEDDGDFEDDDDNEDGDEGNDGRGEAIADSEMDEGREAQKDSGPPQEGGTEEEGANFSAFTLPSAGESSSEDEED